MGKFVVRKTNTGVKFDLKAGNGQVIATSEVYNSDAACKNGIESVIVNFVYDVIVKQIPPTIAFKTLWENKEE